MRGDVIFFVEVLPTVSRHTHRRRSRETMRWTYNFTQKQHILTTHEENPPGNIRVKVSGVHALDGILQDEVCCGALDESEPAAGSIRVGNIPN